jgi:serine phosphatase RsbU (regulator of sigma subunit)/tetratricopeptide (TPR) repeat protein
MSRILCLLLLIFSLTPLLAKVENDTLFNRLVASKDGKDKVLKLNKASEGAWEIGDYTQGLTYANEAKKTAQKINFKKGEAYALNNIGIIHDYLGQYAEAMENYFKALPLQKQINDQEGLAYTYNNIGLIYSNQNNFKKALHYYNLALEIRKKNNDSHGLSSVYNNIGIVQMNQDKHEEALKSYQASIAIDSMINEEYGLSASYSNVGLIYLDLKDYTSSLIYFKKALALRQKLNDKRGIANSYNNIGTLYSRQNKMTEAIEILKKGLKIGLEMGAKDLIQYSYQQLHLIYVDLKDYKNSLETYKLYVTYGDSIINELNTKKQTEAEMQFAFDQEKAKEKLRQEKEKLIIEQDKKQQTYLVWTLIFILFLVVIFSLFLNKRWKIEKAQKHIIEEQKSIVEIKNREILDSITYAKRIQTAILPPDKIVKEYLINSFIYYQPKDIVAGDFYWIQPFENEILFAVADCTGHGVPGALVSVVCHNALNRSVREFSLYEPAQILNKTRELIIHEFQKSDENVNDGMDISICRLNLDTLELKWAGANSPLWIIKNKANELIEYKASKQPIGQFTSYLPFETITLQLDKGDHIYLFSDGYADQFGGVENKKLKTKGLREILLSLNHLTIDEKRVQIEKTFENWRGKNEQLDDVCIIGVQI